MKWNYQCEICDCFLDPGEGKICVECQEKKEKGNKINAPSILIHKEGQYAFDLKKYNVDLMQPLC